MKCGFNCSKESFFISILCLIFGSVNDEKIIRNCVE